MAGPTQFIFPVQLRHVYNEPLIGAINGVNVNFNTIGNYVAGTIQIYKNGLRLTPGFGNDFTEAGLNLVIMEEPPLLGDVFLVDYIKDKC